MQEIELVWEYMPATQIAQMPVDVWKVPASQLLHAVAPAGAPLSEEQLKQLEAPVPLW